MARSGDAHETPLAAHIIERKRREPKATGATADGPPPLLFGPPPFTTQEIVSLGRGLGAYLATFDDTRRRVARWVARGWLPHRAMQAHFDWYEPAFDELTWHESPVSWSAFYDVRLDGRGETAGSVRVTVDAVLGADPYLYPIHEALAVSRQEFYVHEGMAGESVKLRQLGAPSSAVRTCERASSYRGVAGEIWIARVLPPPHPIFDQSVVVAAPIVISAEEAAEWRHGFEDGPPSGVTPDASDRIQEHLMAYCRLRDESGRRLRVEGAVLVRGIAPAQALELGTRDRVTH